ncbi:Uncharacterized protein Fot_32440 [Forsythia ovata]|uniref:Uncharacterized protein n=1 Tax=Forsythia ovata TaxID=205694 RepID=A0ABD1T883_9LAMI
MDKLKADLQNAESNVGEFSKRYDHATRAQEESNAQKKGLVDKVVELKNSLDSLKAENSSLKDENLKLEKSTDEEVKAGIENFINQFEFTQEPPSFLRQLWCSSGALGIDGAPSQS